MYIRKDPTRYYKYAFEYAFSVEILEFCRLLKVRLGFQSFQFSDGKWRFNSLDVVRLIRERYAVEVDQATSSDLNVFLLAEEMRKTTEAKAMELKVATTTDFVVKNIKGELYPYQKIGVEFFLNSGGKAILADSMGLGKSLQALAFIAHLKLPKTLIVCPASVKFSWEIEIAKWTDMRAVIMNSQTVLTDSMFCSHSIFVVNYDILGKLFPSLSTRPFNLLVLDECQYIKSNKAIRTKFTKALAKNIHSKLLLSGTPLLNRPIELYNSLYILDPQRWSNWMDFTKRFCGGKMGYWGYEAKGATNIDELRALIAPNFLRRLKDDVLPDLPKKIFTDVPVELDTVARKTYNLAVDNFQLYLEVMKEKTEEEILRTLSAEKLTKLNELRQITTAGKLKAATEMIENIVDSDEKVIVFSVYNDPLEQLKVKFGKKAVLLTGKSSDDERKEAMKLFQTDPSVKVFLGGIKAAGVGITLTAASNVVFLDYSWVPADHAQAQDRAHRPGNTAQSLNIYQFYSRDTIDDYMRELLAKKSDIFNRIMDGTADSTEMKTNIVAELMKMMGKTAKKGKKRLAKNDLTAVLSKDIL